MKKIILLVLAFALLMALCACTKGDEPQKFTAYYFDYFDTATTIVGYENSQEDFDEVCAKITSLLNEYHKLYTIYNRYDGLNNLCEVNRSENTPLVVDEKIIDLILYAKEMYYETDGMMNVAMGSVLSIWHDYRQRGLNHPDEAALPPIDELLEAAKHVNIDDVVVDAENRTVYLADPEMSLDVGAIAKGYAVEAVAKELEADGITGYILNVGGNVRTIGTRGDGTPWQVGIENPDTSDGDKPYIEYLKLSGQSLVTSGSYQRYYVVDGVNYHHIIDPETLMPGEKYLSVSVLCLDSGLADALSTALFNMDHADGLALVERLENVEAMWVMPNGEQRYSSGFEKYTFEYKE
ncbi:MAG: FAD:protein FMN transferase [Oscillospiraceae bacterium]|nr:FAD:protein FMN transferase [Oscillospiraceae bacterium]